MGVRSWDLARRGAHRPPCVLRARIFSILGKLSPLWRVFLDMHGGQIPWYFRPMDATSAVRRGSRFLTGLALVLTCSLSVIGCDQSAAKAEPKDTAPLSATPAPAPAEKAVAPSEAPGEAEGKPSYKEEAFHLSFEAPSPAEVGKELVFKVVLEARSGFKVNDEYPLKFQFSETPHVRPAKSTVRKEDATLEKERAEMPLSVTIDEKGKHKVSGKLSFSVCTEERCLIEKRDLALEVDAI